MWHNENRRGSESMGTNAGAIPIRDIRDTLNLTQADFAKKVGGSLRSVIRWEHAQAKISPAIAEKVEILNEIVSTARNLMERDEVIQWFNAKNEALGGKKPIDLLGTYKGMIRVQRTLSELEWGVIG